VGCFQLRKAPNGIYIAIFIAEPHASKGYAKETLRHFLRLLNGKIKEPLIWQSDRKNAASRIVALEAGFRPFTSDERVVTYMYVYDDTLLSLKDMLAL
jgi:RimJ/RimL family protein N-acetyltransferase